MAKFLVINLYCQIMHHLLCYTDTNCAFQTLGSLCVPLRMNESIDKAAKQYLISREYISLPP